MFVQKKYPKVSYKLHIELTEEEVERIIRDMTAMHQSLLRNHYHPRSCFRELFQLLGAIKEEASLPGYQEC